MWTDFQMKALIYRGKCWVIQARHTINNEAIIKKGNQQL